MRIATFLAVLCILAFTSCAKPHWTGDAQDFDFKTFDGQSLKLSSFAGKPLVLNFWADWCQPCTEELPGFRETWHAKNKSFAFVSIASPQSNDAAGFAKKNGYDWMVGQSADAFSLYKVEGIPVTVFIDRTGKVSERANSALTKAEFEAKLAKIL